MTVPETLTLAQLTRIDRLPDTAIVIGWSTTPRGPIIRYSSGHRRVVKTDGRLVMAKATV